MANYSKETFQTIYEEWKESGLSVRDFCYQNGFPEFKFYYWRRKMSRSSQLTNAGSFVPASLKQSGGKIELSNRIHRGLPITDGLLSNSSFIGYL
jgi:hypothetical protein